MTTTNIPSSSLVASLLALRHPTATLPCLVSVTRAKDLLPACRLSPLSRGRSSKQLGMALGTWRDSRAFDVSINVEQRRKVPHRPLARPLVRPKVHSSHVYLYGRHQLWRAQRRELDEFRSVSSAVPDGRGQGNRTNAEVQGDCRRYTSNSSPCAG